MKCPDCGIEMIIKATRTEVVNDDTPDKETEVYTVQDLYCRNKECANYGQITESIRHRIN